MSFTGCTSTLLPYFHITENKNNRFKIITITFLMVANTYDSAPTINGRLLRLRYLLTLLTAVIVAAADVTGSAMDKLPT